jgi:nitrogen fixation/metabolism regulation signal transduction histidine kinase
VAQSTFIRSFAFQIVWRIVLLVLCTGLGIVFIVKDILPLLAVLFTIGSISIASYSLFRYVTDTNRRLARFFESIRYSDFAVRFSLGAEKGDSFSELNREFNEVLEAFRQTRAEKEAGLLFMQAVVQHLSTGVLAFDATGNLIISNNAAFQLMGVYRIKSLKDLPEDHHLLAEFTESLHSKGKMLYQPELGRQISVQGVALSLQGRNIRLITLQNIHPELQRKESDAWRNLTRVLRHEIMNSVTPIVTIIETMKDIVHTDLKHTGATADLEEALDVVASRSRSLMDFVEAYRSFSTVPQPRTETLSTARLLDRVVALVAADLKKANITFITPAIDPQLTITADAGLIEMVLINLIKNAREAFTYPSTAIPTITLHALSNTKGNVQILVTDNGPGIEPELLDEIFIPFFTTKTTGTGVGLSISRQIMQLHGGDLSVSSAPGKGSIFIMGFQ